jgi:hypothetical protein
MSTISSTAFRTVLVVLGAISAFVAINVALGGLDTLGWQGSTDYFQITDPHAYLIRDSHARFYGGVYLGIAAFLILAASNLHKYRVACTSLSPSSSSVASRGSPSKRPASASGQISSSPPWLSWSECPPSSSGYQR